MRALRWNSPWLLIAIATAGCMLGFYGTGGASPQSGGRQPFRNAVDQREDMIRELKEIRALLKAQNALLQTLPPPAANAQPSRR